MPGFVVYYLNGFEIYLVKVKTMRMIAQIFVAFSKKLNFNQTVSVCAHFRARTCAGAKIHVRMGSEKNFRNGNLKK